MKLDLRSVALGAVLAVGAGALLSAQTAPALRAVADLLAVKVQGPVAVQTAPAPAAWIEIKEGETYTVPADRIFVVRYALALDPDGGDAEATVNGDDIVEIVRNGVAEGTLRAEDLRTHGDSLTRDIPDGLYRFGPGETIGVVDPTAESVPKVARVVGYLAPAQ